jgi:hypothetical protein
MKACFDVTAGVSISDTSPTPAQFTRRRSGEQPRRTTRRSASAPLERVESTSAKLAGLDARAFTSSKVPTSDGAFMEHRGCNRWQPVERRSGSKTAQTCLAKRTDC